MSIENRRQLENIRKKLQELEELYVKTLHSSEDNAHVRELTRRSLKKRINQFREEIIRFEVRTRSTARETSAPSESEDRPD